MGGPLQRRMEGSKRKGRAGGPPGPPTSAWTEAKAEAVLDALGTFIHNQARKHGVRPEEVQALIRDEVLDPGGPRVSGRPVGLPATVWLDQRGGEWGPTG